ncbi:MAG: HEPN domain-containing protein [Proteobacteria bacterium]|jgi:HEPN domain-containing protein|nr:HEPN domain-containing protein [Pseudomonadota bacterium]
MSERSLDWLRQAEKDIEKAKSDLETGYYEWACFTAQQAAEKAIKGVYQHIHGEAGGHGTKALLENLPFEDRLAWLDDARFLDKLYIPTRYPNGLPQGIPHDYFTKSDAEQAIEAAWRIYEWCKSKISQS